MDTNIQSAPISSTSIANTETAVTEAAQTEFNITLEQVPGEDQKSKRLSIFRLIRELTSVGLKEAKEMTSNLPQIIKESISKEQANEIKNQFEEIGAQVKIS